MKIDHFIKLAINIQTLRDENKHLKQLNITLQKQLLELKELVCEDKIIEERNTFKIVSRLLAETLIKESKRFKLELQKIKDFCVCGRS
jgi:hypothetical protein